MDVIWGKTSVWRFAKYIKFWMANIFNTATLHRFRKDNFYVRYQQTSTALLNLAFVNTLISQAIRNWDLFIWKESEILKYEVKLTGDNLRQMLKFLQTLLFLHLPFRRPKRNDSKSILKLRNVKYKSVKRKR